MSKLSSNIHPLKRNGTSQAERFPFALEPDYVKLDERSLTDLIQQSAEYSKYIAYYQNNDSVRVDNWQSFFKEIYDFDAQKCKFEHLDEIKTLANTSPHLALFISFLQLFQVTTGNLNELQEKHLLFFYEEILQLKRKKASPSKVVLFAELNKTSNSVLIEKNVRFKAGKNKQGQEVFVSCLEDTIVNNAQVNELKNICFKVGNTTQRIKADTADGVSKELKIEPKAWSAFGDVGDRNAVFGFAISSPLLLLEEGIRTITLNFGTIPNINLGDFVSYISTEKGWTKVELPNTTLDPIILNPSFPKIANYDAKVHFGNYSTKDPIIKFELKPEINPNDFLEIYTNINININVKGVKNLRLRNDLGQIDPSKPFYPFGTNPQKDISELLIGYPLLSGSRNIKLTSFENKTILPITGIEKSYSPPSNIIDLKFDEEYTTATQNNYLKLTYDGVYSNAIELVKTITDNHETFKVTIPEIPTWKDLSLDFTINIPDEYLSFYHIHPFGVEEVKKLQSITLIPKYDQESYFYIGIKNLKKGQSVAIHFQMHEGSGNPDVELPIIEWCGMIGNSIKELESKEIIKDTTQGFSHSGIITFALNDDKFEPCSILPDGNIWLVATCDINHNALPRLISVKAQAVEAISDTNIDFEIKPATISKFEFPIGDVKGISQPFLSYGGNIQEDVKAYKTRVSEHLRHKGLAVNIFDYERIILEAFPEIYKVKCISHSDSKSFYEPGKVLLIVIPKIKFDGTQDILKPKVSIGEIKKITEFIKFKISPFVDLEVKNPDYDSVSLSIDVTFMPFISDQSFYQQVLNTKIQEFLSPWIINKRALEFNTGIYIASIIDYIDGLDFVDYINKLAVRKNDVEVKDIIETSSQKCIITSVSNHSITFTKP